MNLRGILSCWLLAVSVSAADLRLEVIPGTDLIVGIPIGWKAILPLDGTIIRRGLADGSAGVAISMTPTTLGATAFAQESLADLERMAYGFERIEWDSPIIVREIVWHRLHFRFVNGETQWEQQLWLTVHNGQAIAIAFSALPKIWPAWAPIFQAAIVGDGSSRPVLKR